MCNHQSTDKFCGSRGSRHLTTDVDIPNNTLTVEWSSDKDGVIGASMPDTDGIVTFPFEDLTVNTHVVTMSVTDELGLSCVADIVYTVGT